MDVFERTLQRVPVPGIASIPGLEIDQIDQDGMEEVFEMNRVIFGEERIINTFDRADVRILVAHFDGAPAGFKVGYRENRFIYYSAKGGVMPEFRRRGIARILMDVSIVEAREMGYSRFAFDTFPNMHPGMTVLALATGFRLVKADFNTAYREHRLRFEKKIRDFPGRKLEEGVDERGER